MSGTQEGVPPLHGADARDAFILRALERFGVPKDEAEAMQLVRLAYGQGYTDGLHEREDGGEG